MISNHLHSLLPKIFLSPLPKIFLSPRSRQLGMLVLAGGAVGVCLWKFGPMCYDLFKKYCPRSSSFPPTPIAVSETTIPELNLFDTLQKSWKEPLQGCSGVSLMPLGLTFQFPTTTREKIRAFETLLKSSNIEYQKIEQRENWVTKATHLSISWSSIQMLLDSPIFFNWKIEDAELLTDIKRQIDNSPLNGYQPFYSQDKKSNAPRTLNSLALSLANLDPTLRQRLKNHERSDTPEKDLPIFLIQYDQKAQNFLIYVPEALESSFELIKYSLALNVERKPFVHHQVSYTQKVTVSRDQMRTLLEMLGLKNIPGGQITRGSSKTYAEDLEKTERLHSYLPQYQTTVMDTLERSLTRIVPGSMGVSLLQTVYHPSGSLIIRIVESPSPSIFSRNLIDYLQSLLPASSLDLMQVSSSSWSPIPHPADGGHSIEISLHEEILPPILSAVFPHQHRRQGYLDQLNQIKASTYQPIFIKGDVRKELRLLDSIAHSLLMYDPTLKSLALKNQAEKSVNYAIIPQIVSENDHLYIYLPETVHQTKLHQGVSSPMPYGEYLSLLYGYAGRAVEKTHVNYNRPDPGCKYTYRIEIPTHNQRALEKFLVFHLQMRSLSTYDKEWALISYGEYVGEPDEYAETFLELFLYHYGSDNAFTQKLVKFQRFPYGKLNLQNLYLRPTPFEFPSKLPFFTKEQMIACLSKYIGKDEANRQTFIQNITQTLSDAFAGTKFFSGQTSKERRTAEELISFTRYLVQLLGKEEIDEAHKQAVVIKLAAEWTLCTEGRAERVQNACFSLRSPQSTDDLREALLLCVQEYKEEVVQKIIASNAQSVHVMAWLRAKIGEEYGLAAPLRTDGYEGVGALQDGDVEYIKQALLNIDANELIKVVHTRMNVKTSEGVLRNGGLIENRLRAILRREGNSEKQINQKLDVLIEYDKNLMCPASLTETAIKLLLIDIEVLYG